jgi:hypothetical protein
MERFIAAMTSSELTPACSSPPSRAMDSSKPKPIVRKLAPELVVLDISSSMDTPVFWLATKNLSSSPAPSSTGTPQFCIAWASASAFFLPSPPIISVTRESGAARSCSVLPLVPRFEFSAAMIPPSPSASAGIFLNTALKSPFSPSSSSPTAPVPIAMPSYTPSRSFAAFQPAAPSAVRAPIPTPIPPAMTFEPTLAILDPADWMPFRSLDSIVLLALSRSLSSSFRSPRIGTLAIPSFSSDTFLLHELNQFALHLGPVHHLGQLPVMRFPLRQLCRRQLSPRPQHALQARQPLGPDQRRRRPGLPGGALLRALLPPPRRLDGHGGLSRGQRPELQDAEPRAESDLFQILDGLPGYAGGLSLLSPSAWFFGS